jgi:uncharacterized protein YycO
MKSLKFKFQKWLVTSPIGNLQIFSRPGWLIFGGSTAYKIKGDQQRVLIKAMRPGDILLRRWNHYASSKMLPGYYSHVGIYVGKSQVIHSVTKPGVISEDVLTFLRCDSIAIYRPRIDKYNKQTAIDRAKSLIGKKYDFVFNFSDEEFFSCSEVIQFCFAGLDDSIQIKPRETGILTKGTIPPDDLQHAGFKKVLEIKG